MKIELSEQQLNNLMIFLDRVEIKGLKELHAMNEILSVFQNPIVEDNKDE